MPVLFSPPAVAPVRLLVPPVLESWDAAGHPSQQRLGAYLDSVVALAPQAVAEGGAPLALVLDVGLAREVALTRGGRDLDNYLFPLARRFGAGRFDAFFARKRHATHSTIAIGPAVLHSPGNAEQAEPLFSVRTSMSATSPAWKQTLHRACRAVQSEPIPGDALRLVLCFEVSGRRNWSTLWKPAIDALGPLLGMPDPSYPFRPLDDRVVDLALHRVVDDTLGHDIVVTVWCSPA
ncbi:hypothetical protein ACWCQN_41175 [Streptomyces sp. NPDC001984]|uniref:hypothetical protein n=1 Tax=Streptomyces sp. NPDC002619 TaxID=3364655 RepID=UPI0036847F63